MTKSISAAPRIQDKEHSNIEMFRSDRLWFVGIGNSLELFRMSWDRSFCRFPIRPKILRLEKTKRRI
ncbi:hypothetical protein CH378_09080 [Leptospira kmetyi]|uniref:Uncharacterized protein n=1 Tax=Leptospira kmetyi TaxID=408139 RepID=A0ABX4NAF9_9LEPT|nr:hypothetical protein CH378_09080 [Leptospira kmetyi]